MTMKAEFHTLMQHDVLTKISLYFPPKMIIIDSFQTRDIFVRGKESWPERSATEGVGE